MELCSGVLIPALGGKSRQIAEFKASLLYRVIRVTHTHTVGRTV